MARLTGPYTGFTGDSARRTTTAEFPLGTRAFGVSGGEYMYVQANGAITAGSAVKLPTAATQTATAAASFDVVYATNVSEVVAGVAEEAFADNEYGWICTRGLCVCRTTDGLASGTQLAATANDGILGLADAAHIGGTVGVSIGTHASATTNPVTVFLA